MHFAITDVFTYQPLDLEDASSFRLVRLLAGTSGPIRCALFHTHTYKGEDALQHEALSYTWGDCINSITIDIDSRSKTVIENLF